MRIAANGLVETVGLSNDLGSQQIGFDLGPLIGRRGYDIPPTLMSLAIDMFTRVHGFVVMEVFARESGILCGIDEAKLLLARPGEASGAGPASDMVIEDFSDIVTPLDRTWNDFSGNRVSINASKE